MRGERMRQVAKWKSWYYVIWLVAKRSVSFIFCLCLSIFFLFGKKSYWALADFTEERIWLEVFYLFAFWAVQDFFEATNVEEAKKFCRLWELSRSNLDDKLPQRLPAKPFNRFLKVLFFFFSKTFLVFADHWFILPWFFFSTHSLCELNIKF